LTGCGNNIYPFNSVQCITLYKCILIPKNWKHSHNFSGNMAMNYVNIFLRVFKHAIPS